MIISNLFQNRAKLKVEIFSGTETNIRSKHNDDLSSRNILYNSDLYIDDV